jgi:acyl-CoA synthetase (AMP-forming)/AMP-acid ligase II
MAGWMNLGQNLKVNAKKFPDNVMLKDSQRSFTYPEVNKRVNQLAHSLLSLGLSKGDKVAVLLENSIEIVEVFLATAKTGIIIVPINFRLVSAEVEYIADNSDAKAFIVHDEFRPGQLYCRRPGGRGLSILRRVYRKRLRQRTRYRGSS